MKNFLPILLGSALLFCLHFSFAQDVPVNPTDIKYGTFYGESAPLRNLPVITDGELKVMFLEGLVKKYNPKLENREYPFAESALPKGPDEAWQKGMGVTPNPKAPILNFSGQTSPYYPPDANGTIGPNHYMQTINTVYAIYNNTTGALMAGPTNMNLLFSGVPGAGVNDGDPIVLYDEQADRWFAAEFSGISSNPDYMLIAVSTTNDPTGTWYRWSFVMNGFPDYMKFGIWRDGYYMGTNTYSGDDIYVFERSVMLTGGSSPQMVQFNNPWRPTTIDGFHCVPPADNDGAFAPSGSPGLFITMNDDAIGGGADQLWIYELAVNWSSPTSSTFNRIQQISVAAFDSNFGTNWYNIRQPGTSMELDAIPMVLMQRPQYRNFGTYETIVCCHTVDVDATDHAGIRWYELRRTTGTWSVRQYGTYAPDANSRWMASIALNGSYELGLGYSISSTSVYPSIRYCGQSASVYNSASGLSTLDIAESVIQAGTNSQTSYERWGDYSNISVDPDDDHTFWFTSQYGGSRQTKIASFQFSSPSSPPVADFSASNTMPASSMVTVNFTDNSTHSPTSWLWTFNPSTVTYVSGSSTSQNPSVRFNNPGAYTVSLYVQNAYGNDTETKTAYIHMGQPGLWTGTTSTNWNTNTNWQNHLTPGSTDNVSITPAAINWPVKTGDLTIGTDCGNISMSSVAQLTVTGDLTINTGSQLYCDAGATIYIGGDWTNNGTFNPGTGSVIFNGTTAGMINVPSGSVTTYLIDDDLSTWYGNWNGNLSTTQSAAGLFSQVNSSYANGTSPEAKFTRNGTNLTTIRRMYYDPVNTTGLNSVNLSFKHYVDRRTGSSYTLTAQYSTNGSLWTNIPGWSIVNPSADLGETVNLTLNSSQGIGVANYYIAFTINGNIRTINAWYIDDVQLSYSSPLSGEETFYNLEVAKTSNPLTTNGDVLVLNNLTVDPDAFLTNATGNTVNVLGQIFLEADPTGMASYIDNGNTSVGGTTYVKQYLAYTPPFQYHLVSAPISDATINTYYDMYLYEYDEPTNDFINLSIPVTAPMEVGKGYYVTGSDQYIGATTVTFATPPPGALNNGNVTISGFTISGPDSNFEGFELVGNPFPCAIDWNSSGDWVRTNLSGWALILDNGVYRGWHPSLGSYNGKTDGIIPSTQGFWVRASNTPATLTIPASQRVHSSQGFYKEGQNNEYARIRLMAIAGNYTDETVILFHPEGNIGFDGYYDLSKFTNPQGTPQLYTQSGEMKFAFNILPEEYEEMVVPVYFGMSTSGTYKIESTEIENIAEEINVYLEDLKEGTVTELKSNPEYEFSYDPLDEPHRFNLHFKDSWYGVEDVNSTMVRIYSYADQVYVQTPEMRSGEIVIYNIMGEEILRKQV
ncbi:MAG: PKD domain-containing protein, partial [Bacteroidales bacterium]|nr:PKD domain-containing protein [Bacteroidales bacterium]